ncbi:D-alanyl-D-alanine carboxypeptidase family protein [Streptomyces sp. GC420]|uniref:D-alanyl-D-alanine carboxypeptidase family protein n=1 Tax=Streptomyces sp. GC420 TaxID=2697568 RepID=UPI0014151246|nr:serine hydrolase [Streptomyces sp. GC420]NBM16933.1 D-alanyl-D-alanine carboxypeptidase [Streptomyces sp. GC420]
MIINSGVRSLCTVALALGVGFLPQLPAAAAPAADPEPALLHRPGTHARPDDDAPPLPSGLSGLSWMVADAGTGEVLAAKNAHRRLPPASTLKTLFAVTVLPRLPSWGRYTVTREDLSDIGSGSSLVGIVAGRSYRVSDMWKGVFLRSGNDAVRALAAMNGGWSATIRQMQRRAEELGAEDTRVVSPDGYDAPGQVSSAYDLTLFAREGLKDPAFTEYASTARARFPGGMDDEGREAPGFEIQSTNRLLAGTHGVEPYPGLIGVKNGYTTEAGNTLISAARRGGRTLLVTVMNPRAGSVFEESRALLDWGFAAWGHTAPVGSLEPPEPPAREPRRHAAGPPPRKRAPRHAAAAAKHTEDERGPWAVAGVWASGLCLAAGALLLLRRGRAC